MKKFIIIAVALIAVAVGVYLYKNKSSDEGVVSSITNSLSGSASSPVLEYVPADTILFAGAAEAIDYDDLMEFNRNMGFNFEGIGDLLAKEDINLDDAPDAAKFGFGFFSTMLDAISGDYPKLLGVPSKTDGAFYTVGALPVLRFSLDGSDTFASVIESIEKEQQVAPKIASLDGVEYREYSFGDDVPVTLVVAINDKQAVVTINTGLDDAKDLKLTLGIEKPSKTFKDSPRLVGLINKHGYEGHQLFLMDNLGLVQGLTDPNANHFGGMLSELMATYGDASSLVDIQTPACKAEYTAMAANWPTISGGYTSYEAKSANYKMVIEGTNAGLLETLQKLHGHLTPAMNSKDLLMGMSAGFNMAEMTGVITDVWKRLTKDAYNCPALAEMQTQLKQNNPVMQLGMMTGMLGGIKGFGFGIVDMDFEAMQQAQGNPMAAADSMSMFVTLSAEDPMSLVQLVGQFQPMLANIELEEGAEPKALPLPLPVEVKGSLRGHDLVISFGEKANAIAANLASNTALDYNGLMSINYDMGKYFGMLDKAIKLESNPDPKAAEFQEVFTKMFANVKGRYTDKTSFTNNGLEINVEMNLDD